MSLKDAEKRLTKNTTCKIGKFIDELDADDRVTFDEWITSKRPSNWIARVCTAAGLSLNGKTLKLHLDGECSCPSEITHRGVYRVAQ